MKEDGVPRYRIDWSPEHSCCYVAEIIDIYRQDDEEERICECTYEKDAYLILGLLNKHNNEIKKGE